MKLFEDSFLRHAGNRKMSVTVIQKGFPPQPEIFVTIGKLTGCPLP